MHYQIPSGKSIFETALASTLPNLIYWSFSCTVYNPQHYSCFPKSKKMDFFEEIRFGISKIANHVVCQDFKKLIILTTRLKQNVLVVFLCIHTYQKHTVKYFFMSPVNILNQYFVNFESQLLFYKSLTAVLRAFATLCKPTNLTIRVFSIFI